MKLTAAQTEVLHDLAEEAGELVATVGRILRGRRGVTRHDLQKAIGDMQASAFLAHTNGLASLGAVSIRFDERLRHLRRRLKHARI